MCGCLSHAPYWGPGPQPRPVPVLPSHPPSMGAALPWDLAEPGPWPISEGPQVAAGSVALAPALLRGEAGNAQTRDELAGDALGSWCSQGLQPKSGDSPAPHPGA